MRQRRITLEDGRYLIFYTFEDEGGPRAAGDEEDAVEDPERVADSSAEAEPQAEEERRV